MLKAYRSCVAAIVLMLAGCASPAHPPSLAPRPGELTMAKSPDYTPPPAVRPIDAGLATKLGNIEAGLAEADTAFNEAAKEAGTGKSGGSVGSEAWIAAQTARSALDVAHQQTTALVADLDDLMAAHAAAAVDDPALGGLSELRAARAAAEAQADRQARVVKPD